MTTLPPEQEQAVLAIVQLALTTPPEVATFRIELATHGWGRGMSVKINVGDGIEFEGLVDLDRRGSGCGWYPTAVDLLAALPKVLKGGAK
jgi:hypothetical protein